MTERGLGDPDCLRRVTTIKQGGGAFTNCRNDCLWPDLSTLGVERLCESGCLRQQVLHTGAFRDHPRMYELPWACSLR